jgi:hypothetical protein
VIRHFQARTAELDLHPADELHVGEMVNRWRHCYVNDLLEIGFSDFTGDMSMSALRGYHGLLVITEGGGELHEGGNVHRFEAGDVLVYEPPVGDSRIVSPGGTKYVYMTQWDSEADRAIVMGPKPPVAG